MPEEFTLTKSRWNWKRPTIDRTSIEKFSETKQAWSESHMYRTSYTDMNSKSPAPKNTYVIPKYAGFIPGSKGNSELGRTSTKISRRCYEKEEHQSFGHRRWASNGFHNDCKTFDETRPSFHRGYGKETRVKPHPCLDEEWSTTFRKTYRKPSERTYPTAHKRINTGDFTNDETQRVNERPITAASGFQANA